MAKPTGCSTCAARDHCVSLCDGAEEWVNQDYVPQREMTVGLMMANSTESIVHVLPEDEEPQFTRIQKSIVTLLLRGHRRERICELLDISYDSFRQHCSRIRRKSHKSS